MGHINTLLGLFFMMIIGYGVKKIGLIKEEHSKLLNIVIVDITLPAFVISHLMGRELNGEMFVTPAVLYGVSFVTVIISYIICQLLKFNSKLTFAVVLTASFANTGFLGYPIVEALFKGNPQAVPTAVIIDQLGMQLLLYISAPIIGGLLVKEKEGEKITLKSILLIFASPVMIASILGIIFHKYTLPDCIMQTCDHLSGATVPLVMLSIGLRIHPKETPKYVIPALIVLILKMIMQPILMHWGVGLLVQEKFIIDVATIQMGLSPAMVTSILIDKYNGDTNFACAAIFVCTMLTVISVPITAGILNI